MRAGRKRAPAGLAQLLLVDDDKVFREEFAECFPGYRFLHAASGEEALAALRRPNEVALVISDVRMSGMDGLSLLERLKELYPALPVLLITGSGSKEVVLKALRARADDYIEKPFSVQKAGEAISRLLGARRETAPGASDADDKIARLKRYLSANLSHNVSLRDAAGVVFLCPKYLSSFFHQHEGMGFSEYKLKLKVDAAKQLLAGGCNVDQTAARLGYENTESFTRQFKKFAGCLPSAYRRRARRPA